ncbi:hypothetical protein B0H19DRAFT_1240465 [Mycena capillaripes]|nr:hypothetical protein B0H19DRAFT_1240465 [Mycena capillaripes]
MTETRSRKRSRLAQSLLDLVQTMEIQELLRSHSQPPDQLAAIISALADELTRYDHEIAQSPPKKLEHLQLQRRTFQVQYDACSSLLAPIRRLPSEILVEIFGLCWESFRPAMDELDSDTISLQTEMARLAHAPLLTVSQVCARWHSIALGTPALWGRIDLEAVLWTAPAHLDTVMELLRSALERSANHPLAVTVSNDAEVVPPHLPAFELLVQHSERWQTATFICPFSDLGCLAGVKAKLPKLTILRLYCWGSPDAARALENFQIIPCLKRIDLHADKTNIASFSHLPWELVTEVRSGEMTREEPSVLTAFIMGRLSPGTALNLRLSLHRQDPENDFPSDVSSITSNIAALTFRVSNFSPICARKTLEAFLRNLTLPSLSEMTFLVADRRPHLPLPWPHSQFLSLAERSSFHAHLHILYLDHVTMSETELLQCLAALPALKLLSIADHLQLPLDGSFEQVLVTDTLLSALIRTPDSSCLVPQLNLFNCRSMLRFDDNVLLNCLLSRRLHGPPGSEPFEWGLWWLPGHQRELDLSVSARIEELRVENEVWFFFAEAEQD